MSLISDFKFNNTGRIGYDTTDNTQRNTQNSKYSSYNVSSFYTDKISDTQMNFVTSFPTLNVQGTALGVGIGNNGIDVDSQLLINSTQERPLEKLQFFQRPFATIPYLGRGSCDPALELQILQGEMVSDKKSVSTIMDKSFMKYTIHPENEKMEEHTKDASNKVEEVAMNGWIRGGISTRNVNDPA
jgi:hypothetical protein